MCTVLPASFSNENTSSLSWQELLMEPKDLYQLFLISTGAWAFKITDTKPYVPAVTLSTQDNTKPLVQWKAGFMQTISWNKY